MSSELFILPIDGMFNSHLAVWCTQNSNRNMIFTPLFLKITNVAVFDDLTDVLERFDKNDFVLSKK